MAIVCATVQPYMANASLLLVRGEYFLMRGAALLDRRVVGHLRVLGVLEVARGDYSLAFWSPTGVSTSVFEAPTLLRMCSGFESLLAIVAIAWAENFGVAMFRNVSAPERASRPTGVATLGLVTLSSPCRRS